MERPLDLADLEIGMIFFIPAIMLGVVLSLLFAMPLDYFAGTHYVSGRVTSSADWWFYIPSLVSFTLMSWLLMLKVNQPLLSGSVR